MHNDAIEILQRGQEEIRDDLRLLRADFAEFREEMAYQRGHQKGRATAVGAISGFVAAIVVNIFGHGATEYFHSFFKK